MLPEKEIEVFCMTPDVMSKIQKIEWLEIDFDRQMIYWIKYIILDPKHFWDNQSFTIREIDLDKIWTP